MNRVWQAQGGEPGAEKLKKIEKKVVVYHLKDEQWPEVRTKAPAP